MKTIATVLALATLTIGGTALAAESAGNVRDQAMTRADMLGRAATMFDRMDANKDGKLDAADREARRAAVFDRMDTNRDGQISRAEFTAPRPAMGREGRRMGGQMGGRMGAHMMPRMADADRDGAVTRQEFLASAGTRFDRIDANKDGTVTPEERRNAHAQMRERMGGMKPATGS